jgi:hypothetical protein
MAKTWTIHNGWNRRNAEGQMVLVQIGPMDFDANYESNIEAHAAGLALPYRASGTSYTFRLKRDYDAAVAQLEKNGFIA